jgi:DNA gyrase/topoisomerase IV subunit B
LYIYTKEEYYEVINKIIASNSEIALQSKPNSNVVNLLSPKNYMKWLKMNAEYTTELDRLQARTACDPLIIEYVCYAATLTDKPTKFKNLLEKEFPEMTYDISNASLTGSYNGESVCLIIDNIFWKAATKFMGILTQNDSIFIYVKNKNNENDDYTTYTIGEFLYFMKRTYTIKIQQRYKGIGEMVADVIFATTLNPKVRRLIRFNMDNVKETLETFDLLHAKTSVMRQQRRDLLDNSEISYMDLDN